MTKKILVGVGARGHNRWLGRVAAPYPHKAEGGEMKYFNRAWYLLIPLVALVPVGLRALSWRSAKGQEVDPRMAEAGKVLFKHQWTPNDPLCNGGDGLGPVFNANSCVACHHQGGDGGAGGLAHNVTTFT